MVGFNPKSLATAKDLRKISFPVFPVLKFVIIDNLYVELQRHGINNQIIAEKILLDLADTHEIPLVATNVFLSFLENCFLKGAGILIRFFESMENVNCPVNVYWLLILK